MKWTVTQMKAIIGYCKTIPDCSNPFLATGRSRDQTSLRRSKLAQLLDNLRTIDCLSEVDTIKLGEAVKAVLVMLPDMYNDNAMSNSEEVDIDGDDKDSLQNYFQLLKLATTIPTSIRTKAADTERNAEKREFNRFVRENLPQIARQRKEAQKVMALESLEKMKIETLKLHVEVDDMRAKKSGRSSSEGREPAINDKVSLKRRQLQLDLAASSEEDHERTDSPDERPMKKRRVRQMTDEALLAEAIMAEVEARNFKLEAKKRRIAAEISAYAEIYERANLLLKLQITKLQQEVLKRQLMQLQQTRQTQHEHENKATKVSDEK